MSEPTVVGPYKIGTSIRVGVYKLGTTTGVGVYKGADPEPEPDPEPSNISDREIVVGLVGTMARWL